MGYDVERSSDEGRDMTKRTALLRVAAGLVLVLAGIVLVACARQSGLSYVAEDRDFTKTTVEDYARALETPAAAGKPVSDAARLRQDALTSLRAEGNDGTALANLLTDQFPGEDRSVPYWAVNARYDGKDAWVVVEVWGSSGGKLENTRVWVFDRASGRVLLSTVFK